MTNYTKTTDFAAKDSLPSGNAAKIVKGSEIDTEFNNIATASATKANKNNAALTGTTTFETISDGTIAITAFVDEDNMVSNSATLLPTQQSVKAYVDSQVTAQDLDFQADTGGALSIDLDSETFTLTGGTGIDTSGLGNAVTFAIDSTVATLTGTQTLSNKTLSAPAVSGNLTTDGLIDGRDVATDGTKLDGIESGATADQTAAEIKTAYESNLNTNAFTDADESKLDGIEALADVTDTANVTAAGALMDSELTNITAVKALNQGVATTDSPSFAGLTTAGLTLGATAITATGTELNYVDGVTSAIQTQLDAKAPTANPTFTGSFTSPGIDDNATSTAMTLDSSGNVGVGVTPQNSSGTWRNFEQGGMNLVGRSAGGADGMVGTNYVFKTDNSEVYKYTAGTSRVFFDDNEIKFQQAASGTAGTAISWSEAMRIAGSGNVGIGTSSPVSQLDVAGTTPTLTIKDTQNKSWTSADTTLGELAFRTSDLSGIGEHNVAFVRAVNDIVSSSTPSGALSFGVSASNANASEAMRIDSSGNLLVGTTTNSSSVAGVTAGNSGLITACRSANYSGIFNRLSTDGDIVQFRKDGTTVGTIASASGLYTVYNSQNNTGFLGVNGSIYYGWNTVQFYPNTDNARDLGISNRRWDDIYATNGTIQTSDRNEKQDIEELSDAERRVAVAAKGLLRKFRWISSVEEKSDEARIHFGIIAQDLQAAFEAEGLDAGRYAMFISSTWTDEETGEERSRMGVRYSELLAFIIAAI